MERSCRCQDFVTLRPGIYYRLGGCFWSVFASEQILVFPHFASLLEGSAQGSINRVTFLMTLIIVEDMGAFWDDAQYKHIRNKE